MDCENYIRNDYVVFKNKRVHLLTQKEFQYAFFIEKNVTEQYV